MSNLLLEQYLERYNSLSATDKEKIDMLKTMSSKEYQLKVIKRKKTYPEIGDVFLLSPIENIFFWGVVVNNRVSNKNGNDLIVVAIISEKVSSENNSFKASMNDLLIPVTIVRDEYWKRGFFYSIANDRALARCFSDYGFYNIVSEVFSDEYGNILADRPKYYGTSGVATINGIAYRIRQEMIFRKL